MKNIGTNAGSAVQRAAMLATALILGSSGVAWGHPGHGSGGLVSGLLHPLSGMDHLLTMVGVGLWAAQIGKRAIWMLPAAFISFMVLGASLSFAGFAMSSALVEPAIGASLLVMGLLIVTACRMPLWAGAGLVAAFAMAHGYAHGAELQAGGSAVRYAAGFVAVTACLHLAGLCMAWMLMAKGKSAVVRMAGASLAVMATMLLMGVW